SQSPRRARDNAHIRRSADEAFREGQGTADDPTALITHRPAPQASSIRRALRVSQPVKTVAPPESRVPREPRSVRGHLPASECALVYRREGGFRAGPRSPAATMLLKPVKNSFQVQPRVSCAK